MLKKFYFSTKSFLASLLFPRICVGCGADIRWICNDCLKTIEIIKQPFCPECRRPTEVGEFCHPTGDHPQGDDFYCKNKFSLDGIFICANFGEGVLKEAIHQFKYNGISDIGGILGKLVSGKLASIKLENKSGIVPEFDIVIPVPLHKKRLRQRGFNQAEILAKEIVKIHRGTLRFKAGALNQHIAKNILVRKKFTVPQAELDREERLNNLKDVFAVHNVGTRHALSLQDKNILLVDDVTTTGATLEECARVLKQNGARSVWGIVLAKGK